MTPTYDGMFLGTGREIELFLLCALGGILLGAVYDTLRAFRISIRHSKAVVFLQDFLFVFLWWLYCFSFCIEFLEGQLRLFVAVGTGLGFLAYRLTLGKVISDLYAKILGFFVKIFEKIADLCKTKFKKLAETGIVQKILSKFEKSTCK